MDDIFDEILSQENKCREDAFRKGVSRGEQIGFEDGFRLGSQRGLAVASEVGYYEGFVTVCLASMLKGDEPNERKKKLCESFLERVQKFPCSDPEYPDLHEDLEAIRAKFKQLCTMLHVKRNQNATSKVDLSF